MEEPGELGDLTKVVVVEVVVATVVEAEVDSTEGTAVATTEVVGTTMAMATMAVDTMAMATTMASREMPGTGLSLKLRKEARAKGVHGEVPIMEEVLTEVPTEAPRSRKPWLT